VIVAAPGFPKPKGRSEEALNERWSIEVAENGLAELEKARASGKSRPWRQWKL